MDRRIRNRYPRNGVISVLWCVQEFTTGCRERREWTKERLDRTIFKHPGYGVISVLCGVREFTTGCREHRKWSGERLDRRIERKQISWLWSDQGFMLCTGVYNRVSGRVLCCVHEFTTGCRDHRKWRRKRLDRRI